MPTITSDVLLLAPLIGHVGNLNMELIGTSRVRHVHQTLSPRAGDVIHPVLWIQGCGLSETILMHCAETSVFLKDYLVIM